MARARSTRTGPTPPAAGAGPELPELSLKLAELREAGAEVLANTDPESGEELGGNLYQVSLDHCTVGPRLVRADTRDDAWEIYKAYCGIIRSSHQPEIQDVLIAEEAKAEE